MRAFPVVILGTFFCLVHICAVAQDLVPIHISHNNKDRVGKMIVQELKQRISSSNALKNANYNELGIRIVIMTMPYSTNNQYEDIISIYSVSWCIDVLGKKKYLPLYITSMVGYCGSMKAKFTAQDILKVTEDIADKNIELIKTKSDTFH